MVKVSDERQVPVVGVEILPFYKFAEKFFAALATNGIQELRGANSDPHACGLTGLCFTAYASYLRSCYEWNPDTAERIRSKCLAAKAAKAPLPPVPVAVP